MKTLPFTKMHGLGNDYVYVDCFQPKVAALIAQTDLYQLARRISDRHRGVGSDGLVLIMPSEVADLRMRMFNADGSEAQMCGNAARCVGRYAFERGMCGSLMTLETLAGIRQIAIHTDIRNRVEQVIVDMGVPVVESHRSFWQRSDRDYVAVDIGNPHAVLFVRTSVDEVPVQTLGPHWEHHPDFPQGTNVEFVQLYNHNELYMRVWERGTGETQACGTGACAAAVAAMLTRHAANELTVHLPGGDLRVRRDEQSGKLYLIGPAEEVFKGEYRIVD
ncbi:MAG: diaminopimelate epimerase [Paludibacteraceae bacterium]|nr:diaminopimelate epimerase [Paludibacteraceae bacterium]